MAYQNVGTPRFYIDWLTVSNALGLHKRTWTHQGYASGSGFTTYTTSGGSIQENIPHHFGINPTHQISYHVTTGYPYVAPLIQYDGIPFDYEKCQWVGVFGHNMASAGNGFRSTIGKFPIGIDYNDADAHDDYKSIVINNSLNHINAVPAPDLDINAVKPEQDGFSIWFVDGTTSGADSSLYKIYKYHQLYYMDEGASVKSGSMAWGHYYDMPHSPDLNLKMSIEMDGIKTQQTKGGATLSNALYTKPADWGDYGCWQLGNQTNFRTGRRVWDLSFSYLSDSDVFPVNASSSYASGGSGDDFDSTILEGTDFFSQVWNRTIGGHLPFIFQPDNNNNNPDQFAICRFDMNSLEYTQVAKNIYNVQLKIRESW